MKSRLRLKLIMIIIFLLWNPPVMCKTLQVPSFFIDVPEEHFAAVSEPCKSLADARKSAIYDVARQVLGSIGSRYDHRFVFNTSGNPKNPQTSMRDNLSRAASGIVLGIEQNIVKSKWYVDQSNRYVFFILVHYPDSLIAKMRNLSLGSKLFATVDGVSDDNVFIRVTEANNVSVTITSAEVTVCKQNRFARLISFFIVRVPDAYSEKYTIELDPVQLCAGAQTVRLGLAGSKSLWDHLLGAKTKHHIELKGNDEVGRAVSVQLAF